MKTETTRAGASWIRACLTRGVATAAAVLIGGNTSAFACPACFAAQESSLIDGAKLGVIVLLALPVLTHSNGYWIPEQQQPSPTSAAH